MKKIAFIIPKIVNIGGIARVVSMLSDELIENKGYDVSIIGYIDGPNDNYSWNKKIKFFSIYKKPITLKKGIFKGTIVLRNILKKNDIDVLIACGSLLGPLGVLATRFSGIKLFYWDHSNYFENTSHAFKIESKNFTARFADVVIPLTKTDKKNYLAHTKAKHVEQVYNPIDSEIFRSVKEYNPDSKMIISVGRLTDQKNFEILVEVAKLVFERVEGFVWHIYGEGPNRNQIANKIVEYNIGDRLILKGMSDNMYSLYSEYCLMVMTSRYEGFPMVLLEGLANKLPLISFDIATGPDEIIHQGDNGFLIASNDVNQMAEKIIYLLKNKVMRNDFAINSQKYVSEFDMAAIASKWDDLISRFTNKN